MDGMARGRVDLPTDRRLEARGFPRFDMFLYFETTASCFLRVSLRLSLFGQPTVALRIISTLPL